MEDNYWLPSPNWGSNIKTIKSCIIIKDYGDGEILIKSDDGTEMNVYTDEIEIG